jgi:hypothetical protein
MARRPLAGLTAVLGLVLGCLVMSGLVQGQQIHRNGFETLKMGWLKGAFDAPYQEKAHEISDQVAHDGRHSEHIKFDAQQGTYIHYAYPSGKALVNEELAASVWIKSNRPGMQLIARVVLPRERDPQNLDHLLTTYMRGDIYDQVGQWQRVELARPVLLAKTQQQLMQRQLNRAIDFTDAYIDGLILNAYGGPGPTDVWIDDVEIGPIVSGTPAQPGVGGKGPVEATPTNTGVTRPTGRGHVEFSPPTLRVGNHPFFFRGIYVTDTPLDKLRDARFNTVFLPETANTALIREATDRGLFVVPMLRLANADGKPRQPGELAEAVGRFSSAEKLFYFVGNAMKYEQNQFVAQWTQQLRGIESGGCPFGGDVWDGMLPYSRELGLIGAHRWPLMTTLELSRYREWLTQRRTLANPGVMLWTSVQTHLPEGITQAIYDRSPDGNFADPIGPQAEHVQLLTYTALAAGARGLVYSSDRFLADSHQGRDRLLACALMNMELEMLEPMLAGASDAPEIADTATSEVKAAVIRSPLGILVLPVWEGPFSQFVPGQAAVNKLVVLAPPMPNSMQAWLISPADVRHLKTERAAGTTKVTVPEFGLTAAIVFTANTELIARFQQQAKGRRQVAAEWAHDLAAYELDKVVKVHDQLRQQNHTVPDAQSLIADAQRRLKASRNMWDSRAFPEAYLEAQRSMRPLRILMRAEWEKAVRGTDSPVTTPYTASYFTLPRHWQLIDEVQPKAAKWDRNVLPGGDFETIAQREQDAWHLHDPESLDQVELIAQRVGEVIEPELKKDPLPGSDPTKSTNDTHPTETPADRPADAPTKNSGPKYIGTIKSPPQQGKLCAMLKIEPKVKGQVPSALERTVLYLQSPEVRLRPGTLVRVSGWICIPNTIRASADGALFYDSASGEAFAVRLNDPTPWKQFTLYRRVPASGTMQVTLALTGIGTVFFDDIRIEPLATPTSGATAGL